MGSRGPGDLELLRGLADAAAMLDAGQPALARNLAAEALKRAVAGADVTGEARALLLLAWHDQEVGRVSRAVRAAQRAAGLFQGQGELADEARALALLSQAHASSGRDAEAVEAALLAVRLGELLPAGDIQPQLALSLATAYLGAKAYDDAEAVLQAARPSAGPRGDGAAAEPTARVIDAMLAWAEVLRLQQLRYFTGALPATAALCDRVGTASPLLRTGARPLPGQPGAHRQAARRLRCAQALAACWAGDPAQSRRLLGDWCRSADGGSLVDRILQHWVTAECEWANRNLHAARRAATELIELAGRAEYEQLAFVGHALRGQILRAMGRFDLALDEERQHRGREWRLQSGRVDGRRRAVQAQLEVRSSLDHLRLLAQRSQELERLSYEDALTGIANRRCFEARIAPLLGSGGAADHPLCLALIDLDDFKRINDTHSHDTGDEVLRAVAQAIRGTVREVDLPARLGGDEFVVLFPHTPLETAQQVCERIQAQVATLRWPLCAPELRVGASIGVAQAQDGDRVADLLRRSDAAMFRGKRRSVRVVA